VGVGIDEAGGDDHVAGVNRLVDRFVPAPLRTDVNDVAAVSDDDPISQVAMPAILKRN